MRTALHDAKNKGARLLLFFVAFIAKTSVTKQSCRQGLVSYNERNDSFIVPSFLASGVEFTRDIGSSQV